MQLAIDSYSYHRYFGDAYAGVQTLPEKRWTVWDFLRAARRLGVAGVSLESCYLSQEESFLNKLAMWLQTHGMECVWAWGHPLGLASGTDQAALQDLCVHAGITARLGAKVMRIVGGSRRTRPVSWPKHRRQLVDMLKKAARGAAREGVVLALENHVDLLADEMVQVMETVDSPWLGVCLDTGNNLRLFEDPVEVATKLAPWTRATHVKDVAALGGNPRDFFFWPSVPLGKGLVDLPAILKTLQRAGYAGLLAIEIDYLHPRWPDERPAVRDSVRYLRSLVEAL